MENSNSKGIGNAFLYMITDTDEILTVRFGVYNNIEQSMEHGKMWVSDRVVPGLVPSSPEEVPSPAASWRRRRSPEEASQVRGATWRSAAAEASDLRRTRRSIMAGIVEMAGSGVMGPSCCRGRRGGDAASVLTAEGIFWAYLP
jgi:hypothetical protein